MNRYAELKNRFQQEIDAFPMKWAFSKEQFDKSMRELGLDPADTDKIIGIPGGGFIRKSDKRRSSNCSAGEKKRWKQPLQKT